MHHIFVVVTTAVAMVHYAASFRISSFISHYNHDSGSISRKGLFQRRPLQQLLSRRKDESRLYDQKITENNDNSNSNNNNGNNNGDPFFSIFSKFRYNPDASARKALGIQDDDNNNNNGENNNEMNEPYCLENMGDDTISDSSSSRSSSSNKTIPTPPKEAPPTTLVLNQPQPSEGEASIAATATEAKKSNSDSNMKVTKRPTFSLTPEQSQIMKEKAMEVADEVVVRFKHCMPPTPGRSCLCFFL